ncbi:MAG: DUF1501 domain-containing protein [Chitinophagaceae bacterium]|nr:MAG: DUF1501 domain-containing protein [Chitinophagaceae bacterium]
MLVSRKRFIHAGSLATASMIIPRFLSAFEAPVQVPAGNKVVIVLQLSGGNDGLNTVIPVSNDIYYRNRPILGIKKADSLKLTDDAGLHPALTAFKAFYDEGSLGILNSVGYPDPDRSHFRSMDIWHSASESDKYLNDGWIGRFLDSQISRSEKPTQALEIDDTLSLALKGKHAKALAMKDPKRLYSSANEKFFKELVRTHQQEHEATTASYLYKTMADTISSADYIFNQSRMHPATAPYPKTEIGNSLRTIASLIFSDINTKVYYLSLGSFDTHVSQNNRQTKLFSDMNDAVDVFVKDLKANNRFQDVLLMSFSEFGRRVIQNASNGTDHGTANNMFFISGGLKKQGLLNPLPDLANLNDGDLKFQVDFKDVYATVLRNWLNANDKEILGKQYQPMDFV